ncbi:MAG: preprotein translocase subunit SecG [Flavobacteriales bacterium]|nr:preprotein translocase subunit SecG [Flavobacteriales bacterium]
MTTFSIFVALISVVCFLLVVVIMVQNPKGGGLSSTFGSSQTIGGVQNTTDFLDKSTWTLAAVLIALILLSNLSVTGGVENGSKLIDETIEVPAATTELPTATEEAVEAATEEAPAAESIDSLIK